MNYFAYPSMGAWLAVPALFLIASAWRRRRRRRLLGVLGEPKTIQRMLPGGLDRRRKWIDGARFGALACFAIALAGPLLGSRLAEFKERGLDVFVAVDCSLSMQTEDLPPSRLAHAKLLLGQLMDRLAGSRLGLIAFAGQAYIQCPLTIDQEAARQALEALEPGAVPIPGTRIGEAIRVAIKGLKAGEGGKGALVLLTDGEDHQSDPVGAAREAARLGMKIFAVGMGSPQGEPIPMFDEQGRRAGYKRDKKGEVIVSRLDENVLSQIARDTGGRYFRAGASGQELEALAGALENLQQGDVKSRLFTRYENRFQWPLVLGILLMIAGLAIPETKAKWQK